MDLQNVPLNLYKTLTVGHQSDHDNYNSRDGNNSMCILTEIFWKPSNRDTYHYLKDIIYTVKAASYFDLHLGIGIKGNLLTKLFKKRNDFSCHIVKFPFICGNISSSPAFGAFISQLTRHAKACCNYNECSNKASCCYKIELITKEVLTGVIRKS